MAEGHVVWKWGGVLTHAARSSENRKSGQDKSRFRPEEGENRGNPPFRASAIFRLHGV